MIGLRSTLAAVLTAPVLALATTTAMPLRSDAATPCGASANDIFGTFVAHRTPAAGAPDAGYKEVSTVTFSAPNKVTTDYESTTPSGQPSASGKGTGTFTVGPPLGWTEQGTYHYNNGTAQGTTAPYQIQFKASNETCTTGTRVTSFTGTGTGSTGGVRASDTETFTRQP